MAVADLNEMSFHAKRARPGRIGTFFDLLAVHPTAPLVDASSEAALSQPVAPRGLRMSLAWWRSQREARQAERAVKRLSETSPHLLRDIGLTDMQCDTGFERHRYGLRGEL